MKGDYPHNQLVRLRWVRHGAKRGAQFVAHVLAENDDDAVDLGHAIRRVMVPDHVRAWFWIQTAPLGRAATHADFKRGDLPWETLDKWEANVPVRVRRIAR